MNLVSRITPTEVAASTGVLASYLVLYSSYSKAKNTLKPELLMKILGLDPGALGQVADCRDVPTGKHPLADLIVPAGVGGVVSAR